MKRKNQIGRIHIRISRGCVDSIKSRGLKEPIELVIHDLDVRIPGDIEGEEVSTYRLGPKRKKGGK
ncbi:unnamed protein product [marine sediment metagenome]|uniref:Uncharacterized protein n=1 Tax=marine sediment metagenome TaxID=412755 RepID=X0UBR0_9ZZZZ